MVSVTFGVYGGVVAKCPEVTQRFLHAAKNLAVEKRVDSLEFRQLGKLDEPLRTTDLYNTFVSEIFDGEEKNMSAISKKQRRMIRQGISHGLQEKIRGEEFLNEFYIVYSSSLRNLGNPAFPFVYFKHRFHDLGNNVNFTRQVWRQGCARCPYLNIWYDYFLDILNTARRPSERLLQEPAIIGYD